MTAANIAFQIITFLVAGHDSTASAMTAFLLEVTSNPEVEAKLLAEIAEVVGDGDVRWEHLPRLKYLTCCQKETLRLHPPAPAFVRIPKKDMLLGGKWALEKNTLLLVPLIAVHTNPQVWGADAAVFKPERWENDGSPPHRFAYLPFASGARGCIGKEFSLVEQKIGLVKLLQHFSLRMPTGDVPRFVDQLFVKPLVKFTLFKRPSFELVERAPNGTLQAQAEKPSLGFTVSAAHSAHGTPLLVLYGSNGGSTYAFAQQFCMRAQALGFKPCLSPMNDMCELSAVAKASKCVVLLSATYNGLPPDQAGTFMAALKVAESSHAQPFRDVAYAVFGAGNTDWDSTYQVVPRLIDLQFAALGARRLLARGVGNSAGDIDLDFTLWSNALWPMLAEFASIELVVSEASTFPNLVVEQTSASPVRLEMAYEADMRLVEMTANRELQPRSTEQSTRHVEFALNGQQYLAGDHLVVMAENEPSIVQQLMDRLGCTMDCVICKPQHDGASTGYSVLTGSNLDGHRPVLLRDLLTKAFDLSRPLSAQCFEYVQTKVTDPFEREQL